LCWPLSVHFPGASAIDGLPIPRQPGADLEEQRLLGLRNGAVRPRSDVQQERPILADDVHQVADDRGCALVVLILDVPPGVRAQGGVRLPERRPRVRQLTPLDVVDCRAFGEGLVLVVDGHAPAPLDAQVVVVGRKAAKPGLKHGRLDPPVEPHELRPVLLYQFAGTGVPVLQEGLIGHRRARLRRTVEARVAWILHVGRELHAPVKEPPVLGAV